MLFEVVKRTISRTGHQIQEIITIYIEEQKLSFRKGLSSYFSTWLTLDLERQEERIFASLVYGGLFAFLWTAGISLDQGCNF